MHRSRLLFALGFIACAIGLATAMGYFQYYLQLAPCPLCIMQRIAFIALAVVYLVATVHNPQGIMRRVYASLVTLIAFVGALISARHVYLQNLPAEEVPQCGPGLDYMLEVMPLDKVLKEVFTASGECSEVLWSLFGITIPGWTLIAFCGFIAYGLWMLLARK